MTNFLLSSLSCSLLQRAHPLLLFLCVLFIFTLFLSLSLSLSRLRFRSRSSQHFYFNHLESIYLIADAISNMYLIFRGGQKLLASQIEWALISTVTLFMCKVYRLTHRFSLWFNLFYTCSDFIARNSPYFYGGDETLHGTRFMNSGGRIESCTLRYKTYWNNKKKKDWTLKNAKDEKLILFSVISIDFISR